MKSKKKNKTRKMRGGTTHRFGGTCNPKYDKDIIIGGKQFKYNLNVVKTPYTKVNIGAGCYIYELTLEACKKYESMFSRSESHEVSIYYIDTRINPLLEDDVIKVCVASNHSSTVSKYISIKPVGTESIEDLYKTLLHMYKETNQRLIKHMTEQNKLSAISSSNRSSRNRSSK